MAIPLDEPPRKRLSFLEKLVRGSFSLIFRTVLLVALLEGALRLFGVEPQIALVNPEGPFVVDPILKWKLKPDWSGKWSEVAFQTNELGLRDEPITTPKPKERFRLLAVGGSITTGYRMERGQIYIDQVEELLSRTQLRPVEVINAAIPGYAPFQILEWLRASGLALEPDLLLIDFAINDVLDKRTNLKQFGGTGEFRGGGAFLRFEEPESVEPAWQRMLDDLPHYSALYTGARWVQRKVLGRYLAAKEGHQQEAQLATLLEKNRDPAVQAAWDETLGELKTILALAQERQIPVWILMFPLRRQVLATSGLDDPQKVIQTFCETHGVTFVDLLSVYRTKLADEGPIERLYLDDDHPTVTGHNLASVTLHRLLLPILAPSAPDAGT